MTIEGIYGEWFDRVLVDGVELDAARSQQLYSHSPDGFAWGYSGSGPAQLALALLLAAGCSDAIAMELHQTFKSEIIAQQPQRGDWKLSLDLEAWAEAKLSAA